MPGELLDLHPVRTGIDVVQGNAGDHGLQSLGGPSVLGVGNLQQGLFLQEQPEQAHRQGLGGALGLAFGVQLEVFEVVPAVDDKKVRLAVAGSRVLVEAGAAADHLPELDAAEDRPGEHERANGGHVDAGIEHVDRDGNARHVLELEVVKCFFGTLHVTVDNFGQTAALIVGKQPVEALVQALCVVVADGEDDALGGQAEDILATHPHEFPDQGVGGAHVGDGLLDVGALEIQLFQVDALFAQLLLETGREGFAVNSADLETGPGIEYPVGSKVALRHGLLIRIVECRDAVFAAEEGERVVVDEIRRRRGQAQLQGIEVVEQGLVSVVDGAMAFVGDDEIVVAWRERAEAAHHAGIGGDVDTGAGRDIAAFHATQAFVRQVLPDRGHGLANQLPSVGQEQNALHAARAEQDVYERDGGAGFSCSGGHHQQEAAPGRVDGFGEAPDRLGLVGSAGDRGIELDPGQGRGVTPLVQQPFEILSGKEAADGSWRIAIPVPEQYFLAVGEKDKRVGAELAGDAVGVVRGLPFARKGIPARAFRFDDGQGYAVRADQYVIHEATGVSMRL